MTRATHYKILYFRVRLKGLEWMTKIYFINHTTAIMSYPHMRTLMMYNFSDDHFFLKIPQNNFYRKISRQIIML